MRRFCPVTRIQVGWNFWKGQVALTAEALRKGRPAPPKDTRFKKGQSGNPRGRPRGRHRRAPYDEILGQVVTVREVGIERRMTAAEAFVLYLTKRALEGDAFASRLVQHAIETAQAASVGMRKRIVVVITYVGFGPTETLEPLRMAKKT